MQKKVLDQVDQVLKACMSLIIIDLPTPPQRRDSLNKTGVSLRFIFETFTLDTLDYLATLDGCYF